MGEIINFHPAEPEIFNFYEVTDTRGVALWGGTSEQEALTWLRRNLRDSGRLILSAWDSDGEDARLIGQPIDITGIVLHAFKEGLKV